MAMPDKEVTRPVLVRRVKRAWEVLQARAERLLRREGEIQEMAAATTLLALADAQWAREEWEETERLRALERAEQVQREARGEPPETA